jgi:hypothetical protein
MLLTTINEIRLIFPKKKKNIYIYIRKDHKDFNDIIIARTDMRHLCLTLKVNDIMVF